MHTVIILQSRLFTDTENPVCLALFDKNTVKESNVFVDDEYLGNLSHLKELLPKETNSNITFNVRDGDLGLIAIDNTREASIKFCEGEDLKNYKIQNSSRSITRLSINGIKVKNSLICKLNDELNKFRTKTHDIFMTAFKGIRADGKYRRRLDYSLARKLIAGCL